LEVDGGVFLRHQFHLDQDNFKHEVVPVQEIEETDPDKAKELKKDLNHNAHIFPSNDFSKIHTNKQRD